MLSIKTVQLPSGLVKKVTITVSVGETLIKADAIAVSPSFFSFIFEIDVGLH